MASKLFERASRYQRTFEAAMPNLPFGLQNALKAPLGSADVGWALALVLASWRLLKESDSGDAQSVLKETGSQSLVDEIDGLAFAMPNALKQALTAAEARDANFADAATYLSQAFDDRFEVQRNAVIKWLGGAEFREAGRALTRRLQPPGSEMTETWSSPPDESNAGRPPPATRVRSRVDRFDRADRPERVPRAVVDETPIVPAESRLDRFDRADRPPRRVPKAIVDDKAIVPAESTTTPSEPAGAPPTLPATPTPSDREVAADLTDRDHCMAFLLGKGFSKEDAEAACQGPHKLMQQVPVKEVFTRARLLGVPILLAFSASWCGPSERWKHEVIEQPDVAAELKKFIVNDVEVDTSKEGEDAAQQLRVTAFPTFIILGGDGHEVGRIVGYRAATRFLAWLQQFDGSHSVKPAALNGATDSQIGFWQRELRKTNISPELRQYYELLLVGNNRYAYPSQEDARAVWTAVLAGPLSDELRNYYSENLKHLGGEVTEV